MSTISLLTGSVGQGGNNRAQDVRIVQRLLNDSLAKERRILLKVDGIVGPKTIAAITAFQKGNTSVADGRIDPLGPTITQLFNKHVAGLVDMFDLSRVSKYVNEAAVKNASLASPDIAGLLQKYADALRNSS
jgi:peptidoglycan hydrolase-like protein with peptidoglycan-binding domain